MTLSYVYVILSSLFTEASLITSTACSNVTATISNPSMDVSSLHVEKPSKEFKYNKKKRPAPPRPIPPKRDIKKIPKKFVNQELKDIERRQIELENHEHMLLGQIQDFILKSSIEALETKDDLDDIDSDIEDAIITRLDLINDIVRLKIDLFRLETFLLHVRKDQSLEEEHASLEHQIRESLALSDALKTTEDKQREDDLIRRLVSVVGKRNEIIEYLESDRLRAIEEDNSIELGLQEFENKMKIENSDKTSFKKKTRPKSIHDVNKKFQEIFKQDDSVNRKTI